MRNGIEQNASWLTVFLLLLLVFKTCTCHQELVTLLGGYGKAKKSLGGKGGGAGCGDHKHRTTGGAGCGDHKHRTTGGDGEAKKPLVIKLFWVDWCGHCNRFKPVWNKLKKENTLDVNYEDVNCEKEKEVAQQEGIQGFPTIRLYDADGNLLEELEGSRDEDNIKNLIKNHN